MCVCVYVYVYYLVVLRVVLMFMHVYVCIYTHGVSPCLFSYVHAGAFVISSYKGMDARCYYYRRWHAGADGAWYYWSWCRPPRSASTVAFYGSHSRCNPFHDVEIDIMLSKRKLCIRKPLLLGGASCCMYVLGRHMTCNWHVRAIKAMLSQIAIFVDANKSC